MSYKKKMCVMMFFDKTPYSLVQNHKVVCTKKGEINPLYNISTSIN